MPVLDIPNLSPSGWEPGVDVGVINGIDYYRPGGAGQRTVLHDVTEAPFSVDDTGATEVNTSITSNLGSVGTNEVVYFPYGVFKITGGINSSSKSNFTYRGAGSGVLSTSSVLIGTGEKVFTVSSGLGWTAGIGCRVWHVNERYKWMQGTVTSYSGTTLTLDITSTSGHSETLDFWTVGQTVLYRDAAVGVFGFSTSASTAGTTAITSSPVAGATTFTVADGSGLYVEPARCIINILPETNDEVYSTRPYYRPVRQTVNWITDVTSNTVTVSQPLLYDLPTGRTPHISMSELNVQGIGIEDMAIFGDGVDQSIFISFDGLYNSWLYRCQIGIEPSYEVFMSGALRCEIAYCYIGETIDGETPSASVIGSGGANRCLIRHSIINWSMVIEGGPDINNAYLYNLGTGVGWAINHGGGSDYNLYEGNIVPFMQADGYHGGCKRYTFLKNWYRGPLYSLPQYAMLVLNRFGRQHNTVGNVMGLTGIAEGLHSQGEPNSGGAPATGSCNSTLYVESGGVSGSLWVHLDATGIPRATGTLTAKSGDEATIVLDDLTITDFSPPYLLDPNVTLVWGTVASPSYIANCSVLEGSSSGSSIVIQDVAGGGAGFPAVSTAVSLMPFFGGYQEFDDAVAYSAFNKENYKYGVNGAAGSIIDPTDDTIPNSLAYTAQPSDWPESITWPVAISPDSPNVGDAVIPAQVFFNTGQWPDADPPPSGSTVTFSGSGSTTFGGSGTVTFA